MLLGGLALSTLSSFALPTPAPDPLAVAPFNSTYRVERGEAAGLAYLVVEPPHLPADARLPMVVQLHGRGSYPTPPRGAWMDLATPVRLVLPRGPEVFGDGYAWMPVSAHDGESAELIEAVTARTRMLANALVAWQQRYPTRGAPIVTGFSQGGILTMNLAITHPADVSSALVVAGWLPPSLTPTAYDPYAVHVPTAFLHGRDDDILPFRRTKKLVRRLETLGYPVRLSAFSRVGHEMNHAMRRRLKALVERALRRLPESSKSAGTA